MLENIEITEQDAKESETETGMWLHDKVEDPKYVGGWKILPSCTCSKCGYHANKEKAVCPNCGAKMRS
ncbi:MAG: hypothetical protein IKE94_06435 [Aeriscardovia sp.]|nr:hypothetical protein [Aeriscardovia sp.]